MFIFRVLVFFFVLISPISNEDLSYDFWNGDETNELLSADYEYNQPGSEQEDTFNLAANLVPERGNTALRIDSIIGSIREDSVHILQEIGNLEDILAGRINASKPVSTTSSSSSSSATSSSSTSKYVFNDMTIPSKGVNITNEPPKDILEEGKAKIKVWEEQIKLCKSILENAKLPGGKDIAKSSLVKPQEKKKPIKSVAKKNEETGNEKIKRRRRRLLHEGMENFRQVYTL